MQIKRFEFNMFSVNSYLLWDQESKEAVLIDAGCFFKEDKANLDRFIADNQLNLKYLLNTHLHLDHAFGNPYMLNKYNLKALAHSEDEFLLGKIKDQALMFGFQLDEDPVPLGGYLKEGDVISFGKYNLSVIHIPGHSPGGVVFYEPKEKIVFCGDVLFQGSVGRADLEGGDFDQLIHSIKEKLLCLPEETLVYPGHGPSTTIGKEKRSNPFLI